jgi:hypothetical protein
MEAPVATARERSPARGFSARQFGEVGVGGIQDISAFSLDVASRTPGIHDFNAVNPLIL